MLLSLPLALAADPHDLDRVDYLRETGRADEAASLATRLLRAEPESLAVRLAWLYAHLGDGAEAAGVALRLTRAWAAAKPGDPSRRVAVALATGIDAAKGESDFPRKPGPWCDEVLALLDPLPAEPADRERGAWLTHRASEACKRDDAAAQAVILSLAKASPRARTHAVRLRLADELVDPDDAAAISDLLAATSWRMDELTRLWKDRVAGDGLEGARKDCLAGADLALESDDPMRVAAALSVFLAAKDDGSANAAADRLERLDPDRPHTPRPRPDGPAREVEALSLSSPAERLASLDAHRPAPGAGRWDRFTWTRERAAALQALGRNGEALDALRRAYILDPGVEWNVRFAREAAVQRRLLGPALRAAHVAVWTHRHPKDDAGFASPDAGGAGRLAEALSVRAAVRLARGDKAGAAEDAWEATLLDDQARHHLRLGLAWAAMGRDGALVELTRALAGGGSGDARVDGPARGLVARLLDDSGWWADGGVDAWIAAFEASSAPTSPREPFPDVTVTVAGETTTIGALTGPMVVEVWATWCGPCRQALPELDEAARRRPDVRFVALSVDDDPAKLAPFLSKSTPAFTVAWGGKAAWDALDLHGIPMAYALDADHRIVASHRGWTPGGGSMDALLAALPPPP
jgi:thiol-disulfide isomerase/thioredoxin